MGSDKGMQSRSIAVHYQHRFAASSSALFPVDPAGIVQRAVK
jgi:hypothetical protein